MSRKPGAPRLRSTPRSASSRVALVFGFGILVVAAIASVAAIGPPALLQANAPAEQFSAVRALAHLAVIARAPRPVGSPAHARARDYVARTLEEVGFEVDLQRTRVVVRMAGNLMGADVENVVARRRGTAPRQRSGDPGHAAQPGWAAGEPSAVLLAAHYDSVPNSPGASDDGSAVAALLETARALAAGPPLPNDVIVLLSDAEELGLLGAIGFVRDHRWRQDVAVALNFEARGCRGAVAMYATSAGSAPLVDALARATDRPVANSLVGLLARALPNDTDATVFARAGMPTYAFAYAAGVEHYHQQTDDLARHEPRSMQHQGDYALAMTRELGRAAAGSLRSTEESVYFDLFGRWVVRYPPWLGRALALIEALGLGWLLLRLALRGALRWRSVALGAAVAVGTLLVLALGTVLAGLGIGRLLATAVLIERDARMAWLVGLLSGGLWVACWLWPLRSTDASSVALGALLPVAVVGVGVGLALPTAGYPWVWTLAGAIPAIPLWFGRLNEPDRRTDLAVTLPLLPGAVLWSSTIYTVHVLQGVFTPVADAVVLALPAPLLVPLLARLRPGERRGACAALLVAAAAAAVAVAWPVGSERPGSDSLRYLLDADRGEAHWVSNDPRSDSFVSQRVAPTATLASMAAFSPWDEQARAVDARTFSVPGPELLAESTAPSLLRPSGVESRSVLPQLPMPPESHTVQLRVGTPASARCLLLWDDEGDRVLGARFDDRLVVDLPRFSPERDEELLTLATGRKSRARWRVHYCGLRGRPLELRLAVRGEGPPIIRAVTVTDGLPDQQLAPRPTNRYPAMDSDVTLVSRRLVVPTAR